MVDSIVERIASDAENEAGETIARAKREAEALVQGALESAEKEKAKAIAESEEKARAVKEGMAASARLDGQKILLKEKRRALDEIYAAALKELLALDKKRTLALTNSLLEQYAEEGDEIVFSASFACEKEAAQLPVIAGKKLKISAEKAPVEGGFLLRGKKCDKDVSYRALLEQDRGEHQTEIAKKLFRVT